MAIQPIDLQTLFTQVEKVGKNQAVQREGLQIQAALHQVQSRKKAEEQVQSVNEAQDAGDGAERIKDENSRRPPAGQGREKPPDGEEEPENEERENLIRDPTLGRNIDISG
ncbi:MAG: hypothetical protein LBQ67_02095 [Treponema sp.]|jgi:hypothetical protein|nr:hypothetical protein [Treponema sp.]